MVTDQPEWRLSHYVDMLLDRVMMKPCWYSAIEGGSIMVAQSVEARMQNAARRKARGIKPSHLDWMVYQHPRYSQFELKYGEAKPSAGQAVTIGLLKEQGIPAGCLNSILDVYRFLAVAGFNLHANAANIATEIEARWRARDDEKRLTPPKIKSSPRPRVSKPSSDQIKRLTAMRATGVRF